MLKENKKKIAVFLFMAVCVAISMAAHNPEAKQQGYKDLQILPKDISKDSLDHVMHFFTKSLGVHCDFCHAKSKDSTQRWPDFAADKPEKSAARHMMVMAKEINVKYFNWMGSTMPDTIREVTCMTCHHGNPHPESMVTMDPPRPPMGQPGQPGQPGNGQPQPPPPGKQ